MQKYWKLLGILLVSSYFLFCAASPGAWHFLDNVDLIFHEAGHTVFFFLPKFFTILAGSAFQVFIPVFIASYFFLKQQWFSSAFILLWVGQSIINVSVYTKDATLMQLPLLGGESVIHDWNYLLTATNLLKYTSQIGSGMYLLGVTTILFSTISLLLLWVKRVREI